MLYEIGVRDYRIVSKRRLTLSDGGLEKKLMGVDFYSMTVRAFKLEDLEDRCEDYGQVAYYLGSLPQNPCAFRLDDHHLFETKRPVLVCSNTASMLVHSRYQPHFKIMGDRSRHFGLFPCSPIVPEGAFEARGAERTITGACC